MGRACGIFRGPRRPHRRRGGAAPPRARTRRSQRCARVCFAACGGVWKRECLRGNPASPPPRRGAGKRCAARSRSGVRPPAARDERRASRDARRARGARCLHLRAQPHAPRRSGPPAVAERRAALQARRADGASFCRCAGSRDEHRAPRGAPRLHARKTRLRIPALPRAGGRDDGFLSPQGDARRCARALRKTRPAGMRAARTRTRAHRAARVQRIFSHRLGSRELLQSAGHPRAGTRQRGEQRGVLLPRHHRVRSHRVQAAFRAVPERGAHVVAGHRSRSAERRPPRARDPGSVPALRQTRRGDDGKRDHLPRTQRDARDRQGA